MADGADRAARHERAREQTISWMVDAVRRGDYMEAVQWLDTLAAVDDRFSLTADEIIARWRARAARFRGGVTPPEVDGIDGAEAADFRGLFGTLLQRSYDGILVSSVTDGWILECSRSFCELSGYSREDLLGRTTVELGLVEADVRAAAVGTPAEKRPPGGFRTVLRRKDGTVRWIEFSPEVLAGDELLLTIVRDITDLKADEDRMRRLADRDPLTGLYNERRFREIVEPRLREGSRRDDYGTLVLVRFDGLKALSDEHGVQAGDDVLCAVADLLTEVVRDSDVIGRLAGAAFGVVLTRATSAAAERVTENLEEHLKELEIPRGADLRPHIGVVELDGTFEDYPSLIDAARGRVAGA